MRGLRLWLTQKWNVVKATSQTKRMSITAMRTNRCDNCEKFWKWKIKTNRKFEIAVAVDEPATVDWPKLGAAHDCTAWHRRPPRRPPTTAPAAARHWPVHRKCLPQCRPGPHGNDPAPVPARHRQSTAKQASVNRQVHWKVAGSWHSHLKTHIDGEMPLVRVEQHVGEVAPVLVPWLWSVDEASLHAVVGNQIQRDLQWGKWHEHDLIERHK